MNWAKHQFLYQLFHPWHWLAYGQNASVVGLLVLIAYTLYTRQMMKAAEQTRRGSFAVALSLSVVREPEARETFSVHNVGGPALNILWWRSPVPNDYVLDPTLFLKQPHIQHITKIAALGSGERREFPAVVQPLGSKFLYAAEFSDLFGGRGQMRLLRHVVTDGGIMEQHSYLARDNYAPLSVAAWHYLKSKCKRFVGRRAISRQ